MLVRNFLSSKLLSFFLVTNLNTFYALSARYQLDHHEVNSKGLAIFVSGGDWQPGSQLIFAGTINGTLSAQIVFTCSKSFGNGVAIVVSEWPVKSKSLLPCVFSYCFVLEQ